MNKAVFVILVALLCACSIEPETINYGSDQCHFCKMNIADVQHSAQMVTSKGKQFKYDAIECMINDLENKEENNMSYILVADYSQPGQMINASDAVYLISKKIKSPMGAFLLATASQDSATKIQNENGGTLYNWNEIKIKLGENQ